MIKIGAMVFSSNTGLGIQTESFCKHMNPYRVMVVDISNLNNMKINHHRYPNAFCVTRGLPTDAELDNFLLGLDVLFVCETPLNYYAFTRAKELGVKTVLQYNYEMLDYFQTPNLPKPDMFGAPTEWGIEIMRNNFQGVQPLPVPIDVNVQIRKITKARTFLHIMGRPACGDRNGTNIFLKASTQFPYSDIKFIVRVQDTAVGQQMQRDYPNVEVIYGDLADNSELYEQGDILVMPRRFGGLCLPVNEALARGIPVIMPDCSPNDMLLPRSWLLPCVSSGKIMAKHLIDSFEVQVGELVNRIRDFSNRESIIGDCILAREIAESRSWGIMQPVYTSLLNSLCERESSKLT